MVPNPFVSDIFPDGYPASGQHTLLHVLAISQLKQAVDELAAGVAVPRGGGRLIQLRAPRAGYGKSHLLESLRQNLGAEALFYRMDHDVDREFRWSNVFWGLLDFLHRTTGSSRVTYLDELSRVTFAKLNRQLISSGRISCADPQGALATLETRAVELFDLTDPAQPVGQWFSEHFERLLPGMSGHLAGELKIGENAANNWLRLLCSYNQGLRELPAVRFENFRWMAQQGGGEPALNRGGMQLVQVAPMGESYFKDRLAEFCRLLSQWKPLVLVFDHLDAVYGDAEQTRRAAHIIGELRRLLPQVLIILSINDDLWNQAFQKFLPSALEDRLSGEELTLQPISRTDAEMLVRSRLVGAEVPVAQADAFMQVCNLPELFARESGRALTARNILRHAARLWQNKTAQPAHSMLPSLNPQGSSGDPAPILFPGATMAQLRELLGKAAALRNEPALPEVPTPGPAAHVLPDPVVLPDPPVHPSPIFEPLLDPRAQAAAIPAPAGVWERCQQLRKKLLEARNLRIDPDLFCHLLEAGGRHLAVVSAQHVSVPGSSGPGALVWHTPDGEIFFGTESHDDRAYWRALWSHVKTLRLATPPTARRQVWMTVFSLTKAPLNLADWLDAEDVRLVRQHMDLVELDSDQLATLYAVDEVLHESERPNSGLPDPGNSFTTLAPLLESFWKRITRPLASEATPQAQ
jgi:hypothetical protein